MSADAADPMLIVYDGECPFCSAYVRMLRLRDAAGPVALVDARGGHPAVAMLRARGYDLDEGMALVEGFATGAPRVAHGQDCINRLALMTTRSGAFNRLNAAVFRSERRARALYPVMRAGRNAALRLLGRKRIADAPDPAATPTSEG